jgi:hypothetical protein
LASGGAAATGATRSGDIERMSDTVNDTAKESRRNAFICVDLDLTSCCRNPTSPRYHAVVDRGVWCPAGNEMARILPHRQRYSTTPGLPLKPTARRQRTRPACYDLSEKCHACLTTRPRRGADVAERHIVDPPQRHLTSGSKG